MIASVPRDVERSPCRKMRFRRQSGGKSKIYRDIGSISNLRGHDTSRALFSSRKGAIF